MEQAERIHVDLGTNAYDVLIAHGMLDLLGEQVQKLVKAGKVAVVTNPKIDRLYGDAVRAGLRKVGYEPLMIHLPSGERYKTLKSISRIYDHLIQNRFERGDALIALGGGVIGDMCGFAAATFLRGISYIQCPTTVVAQVDASIGGKTGVDHPRGKNLIGAFHQPRLVCTDPATLKTLSRREYRAGLAEVVKYGVICDAGFFRYLEANSDAILALEPEKLGHCISRSSEIKVEVVQSDEQESGRRKILNYGHTIGHAIETLTAYSRYRHGEAVAIGMVVASRFACHLGLLAESEIERQVALLEAFGLSTQWPDLDPGDIIDVMEGDKKVVGGEIYFVLPREIGAVEVMQVDKKVLRRFLKALPA